MKPELPSRSSSDEGYRGLHENQEPTDPPQGGSGVYYGPPQGDAPVLAAGCTPSHGDTPSGWFPPNTDDVVQPFPDSFAKKMAALDDLDGQIGQEDPAMNSAAYAVWDRISVVRETEVTVKAVQHVLDNIDEILPDRKREPDPNFVRCLLEVLELHCKKGRDYGTDDDHYANIRASEDYGVEDWRAAVLKASDKVSRIKSYCDRGELANEGFEDALLDASNYFLIALRLWRERLKKTVKKTGIGP